MPRAPRTEGSESIEAYLQSLQDLHDRLDEGVSFSGHERNRVFLNCAGRGFATVSTVAGLDFPDDARGLAVFDWDHDGDLDVVFSNRTAPRVRMMRNSSPASDAWVSFVLEGDGVTSNRDAVGARVAVETAGGTLLRTVRAGQGFLSQSSLTVHFGLRDNSLRGAVTVRWPGGTEETFEGVAAGGRYRLVQSRGRALRLEEPERQIALRVSDQMPQSPTTGQRVVLASRPPVPALTIRPSGSENEVRIDAVGERPLLLNVWASWCGPCREELREFTEHADAIRTAGLEIVALSTDGLGENPRTRPQQAQEFLSGLRFPFLHGFATPETLDKVEIIRRFLFDRSVPLSLPFSLLLDADGRVAVLYRGGVDSADLIADLAILDDSAAELRALAVPFEGRWFRRPSERVSIRAYARWFESRFPEESVALLEQAALEGAGDELSAIYRALASVEKKRGNHEASAGHYRSILALEPDDGVARSALLNALFEAGDIDEVRAQIEVWLATDPSQVDLRVRLAEVHARQGRLEDASTELARAVDLDPAAAGVRTLLGQTLARLGRVGEATRQFEAAVRLAPRNAEALLGLARLYVASGRPGRALPYLETLVRTAPENAPALHELGVTLLRVGRLSEGVEYVRRAYTLDERFFEAANNVAFVLSSRPEADLRDGALALRIARELNAKTGYRELAYLETLAAAFAETGDFDAAVETTEAAIEIARQAGESRAAEGLIDRLELYRRGRPVRVPGRSRPGVR